MLHGIKENKLSRVRDKKCKTFMLFLHLPIILLITFNIIRNAQLNVICINIDLLKDAFGLCLVWNFHFNFYIAFTPFSVIIMLQKIKFYSKMFLGYYRLNLFNLSVQSICSIFKIISLHLSNLWIGGKITSRSRAGREENKPIELRRIRKLTNIIKEGRSTDSRKFVTEIKKDNFMNIFHQYYRGGGVVSAKSHQQNYITFIDLKRFYKIQIKSRRILKQILFQQIVLQIEIANVTYLPAILAMADLLRTLFFIKS